MAECLGMGAGAAKTLAFDDGGLVGVRELQRQARAGLPAPMTIAAYRWFIFLPTVRPAAG